MNSKHDHYPVCDIDEAILILDDLISGADEDRARDSRISEVTRLLRHLKAEEVKRHSLYPQAPDALP